MSVFTKELMTDLFRDLWLKMINETEVGSNFKESKMSVLFIIDEPNVTLYVDKDGPLFDEDVKDKTPEIIMKMSGDIVHKFWLKRILVPKALAIKQIEVKGSVGKVLQMLPMLEPGHQLYSECCRKFNLAIIN